MEVPQMLRGNRGGRVLVHEGYRYQLNKTKNERSYWRCWRPECRATLVSSSLAVADPPVVIRASDHDHVVDDEMVQRDGFREEVREIIRQEPEVPVRRVFDRLVVRHRAQGPIPAFQQIEATLNRTRRAEVPPVPRRVEDVIIPAGWRHTNNGKRFKLYQSNNWGILIFGTKKCIRLLAQSEIIYMDGTFKTAPSPYRQLFTIHGRAANRIVPMIYAFMTTKTTAAYRQLLRAVKRKVRHIAHRQLAPQGVVCDFEVSLHNALEAELNNTQIKGCYFHLVQSFTRRAFELGLKRPMREDVALRRCIRKYAAIAHLPQNMMWQTFQAHTHASQALLARWPALREFQEYIVGNYFRGTFPPAMWCVYERSMEERTNNVIEGWNSAWNRSVGTGQASLWIILRRLKDQQTKTQQSIREAMRGDPAPRRKRKWRELERRIVRLRREYEEGQRNTAQFHAAIAYAIAGIL